MKKIIFAILILLSGVSITHAASPIEAMKNTFGEEGVLNCDKTDPGNKAADGTYGCTKYGVSHRSYPKVDIRNLTADSAAAYMNQDFWLPLGLDKVADQLFADLAFDAGWNQGEPTLAKDIQKAINLSNDNKFANIKVDGKIGPKTIALLNSEDHTEAIINLLILVGSRYQDIATTNPKMKKMWYKSWMYRIKHNIIVGVHLYEAQLAVAKKVKK